MSPLPWPLIGRIRRPQPEPPRPPDIPRPTGPHKAAQPRQGGDPMKPEDVPGTLVDLAMAAELALREQHRPEHQDLQRFRSQNPATAAMHETAVRHLLAAVLPAHERQVREQVAEQAEPVLKDLRKAARTHHYLLACEGTDKALGRLRAVLRGES